MEALNAAQRGKLVMDNLGFAYHIAKVLTWDWQHLEDAQAAGLLGLTLAASHYDPLKGAFGAYMRQWVVGHIRDANRDARRPNDPLDWTDPPDPTRSAREEVLQRERIQAIRNAVRQLPDSERRLVEDHFLNDPPKPLTRIAAERHEHLNTLRRELQRTLAKLARLPRIRSIA